MSFDFAVRRRIGDFQCDLDFSTGPGLTAVLGSSGAGKTSLMYMAAGVTRPDSGRIAIAGRTLFDRAAGVDIAVEQRHCGYIFQDGRLFPHLPVRANLLYGAKLARGRAPLMGLDEVVDFLGIAALLDRRPATLSGGEAQRVAIGRALLGSPAFLLMDEPLSGLDTPRKGEIMAVIERLRDEVKIPILFVSHDSAEVERLADHLVLIEDGRVRASGPINAVQTDLGQKLARASDAMVVLLAEAQGYDEAYDITTARLGEILLQIPGRWTPAARPLRLHVRANDVALMVGDAPQSSVLNSLPATIIAAETTGSAHMSVMLALTGGGDGARLLASVTRKSWDRLGLAVGQSLIANIKAMALTEPRARS